MVDCFFVFFIFLFVLNVVPQRSFIVKTNETPGDGVGGRGKKPAEPLETPPVEAQRGGWRRRGDDKGRRVLRPPVNSHLWYTYINVLY